MPKSVFRRSHFCIFVKSRKHLKHWLPHCGQVSHFQQKSALARVRTWNCFNTRLDHFITQWTCGLSTVTTKVPWSTGYGESYRNAFVRRG